MSHVGRGLRSEECGIRMRQRVWVLGVRRCREMVCRAWGTVTCSAGGGVGRYLVLGFWRGMGMGKGKGIYETFPYYKAWYGPATRSTCTRCWLRTCYLLIELRGL